MIGDDPLDDGARTFENPLVPVVPFEPEPDRAALQDEPIDVDSRIESLVPPPHTPPLGNELLDEPPEVLGRDVLDDRMPQEPAPPTHGPDAPPFGQREQTYAPPP